MSYLEKVLAGDVELCCLLADRLVLTVQVWQLAQTRGHLHTKLKGQSNKIFDLLFHNSNLSRPLTNMLKKMILVKNFKNWLHVVWYPREVKENVKINLAFLICCLFGQIPNWPFIKPIIRCIPSTYNMFFRLWSSVSDSDSGFCWIRIQGLKKDLKC